jgi:exopolyphosphatase/guanosine-5'-triphosphate,3'-diphosphate pyrophosphatase
VAALDLGSNSLSLLVADVSESADIRTVAREKVVLGLGAIVAREGSIPPSSVADVVEAANRFRAIVDAEEVDVISVCATSAFRDAKNGTAVAGRVGTIMDSPVRVISGAEEAALVFRAVQASVLLDPSPAVGLDLGGGSLELTVGDHRGLRWSESLALGTGRLTSELVKHDPLSKGDRRRLAERIEEALAPAFAEISAREPQQLVGSGGTMRDLARAVANRSSDGLAVTSTQVSVSVAELALLADELADLDEPARSSIGGIDPRRAAQIPAGAMVVVRAAEGLGFREITVSAWGLREGMVLEAAGCPAPDEPRLTRRASVLDLAQRCGWEEPHARHVAELATQLFDQTRGIHDLGADERELLEYGALLHDIGRHIAAADHHKHAAYLIEHGGLRAFSRAELATVMCLGRFHRSGEPKTSFQPFARLGPDEQEVVRWLVALLQVADGLDRSHAGSVVRVDVATSPQLITIRLTGEGPSEMERWSAEARGALLSSVTGREVRVVRNEATPASA